MDKPRHLTARERKETELFGSPEVRDAFAKRSAEKYVHNLLVDQILYMGPTTQRQKNGRDNIHCRFLNL